jgi:hypothetical protein
MPQPTQQIAAGDLPGIELMADEDPQRRANRPQRQQAERTANHLSAPVHVSRSATFTVLDQAATRRQDARPFFTRPVW